MRLDQADRIMLGDREVSLVYLGANLVWSSAFSPASLFAQGEPGVWYDPSDLSTMFQDAAGTTPVTAVEQPVGLMLDKSKGLVLGPELVTNGTFDTDTWWSKGSNCTIANGVGVASGAGNESGWYRTGFVTVGKYYEITFTVVSISSGGFKVGFIGGPGTVRSQPGTYTVRILASGTTFGILTAGANTTGTIDNISVRELPGNHASQTTATSRPVLSARVNQYLATETLATQNVTTLAAQYLLSFEGAGTITLSGTATGVYSAGSHLITCTTGTLTSTVSGSVTKADLRVANAGVNLPPYQRVNTATDYDTAGFPQYLRFDGVDDGMVTNTITPGTDKVQVFAGVRKLNDAAAGAVAELSANINSNNGAFHLFAPANVYPSGDYVVASRGSAFSGSNAARYAVNAPNTSTVTLTADIAGDLVALRTNGVSRSSGTGDQGTGNFLAYPLYIGRRGGTLYPFNGHIYSLIVRFGSNLPVATIEKTEKYINTKTRAY